VAKEKTRRFRFDVELRPIDPNDDNPGEFWRLCLGIDAANEFEARRAILEKAYRDGMIVKSIRPKVRKAT
jgi:hypothetical protein